MTSFNMAAKVSRNLDAHKNTFSPGFAYMLKGLIIGPSNGLLPVGRQATYTKDDVLSIWPLETSLVEIWRKILTFSLMKIYL